MFWIQETNPYFFPAFFGLALLLLVLSVALKSEKPKVNGWALLIAIWGGFAGSRLWHALQYSDFSIVGGLSAWGFAIGAFVSSLLFLRKTESNWGGDFWDTVSPAIVLGGALTRIGCFFAGCNFGSTTSLAWSVRYGPDSPAFHKQVRLGLLGPEARWTCPIHPAQLYESLALLFAFGWLLVLPRIRAIRLLRHELFLGMTAYYGLVRFLLEYLRDDAGGVQIGPFTFAQATCVLVFLLAASVLARNRLRHREPH